MFFLKTIKNRQQSSYVLVPNGLQGVLVTLHRAVGQVDSEVVHCEREVFRGHAR